MKFFRKGVNEEFDDSVYYVDDPAEYHAAENPSKNPLKFGALTFISVLGVAFGANLLINVTSGNQIEFGQAIQVTAVCQGKTSPSTNMLLTPNAGFQNANGTGKFTLDSIVLENVDRACVGKDFTIKVFDNSSSNALTIDETETSLGVYQGFQSFRFFWQDSITVTSKSPQYTEVELLNDTSDATDFNANINSFIITFNPDQVANYADATQVYKITIETNDPTN